MHNKLVVMDNALAIVGGRNMGDPYFEVDPGFNFRDLDIAAAGPVVRDLSKSSTGSGTANGPCRSRRWSTAPTARTTCASRAKRA